LDFLRENYKESMNTVGSIFSVPSLISKNSFIQKSYEQYQEGYNSTIIPIEKLIELVRISKENVWFSYLVKSYNEELRWIDFEMEIAKVLEAFREFFSKLTSIKFSFNHLKLTDECRFIISHFNFFYTDTFKSSTSFDNLMHIQVGYFDEEPHGSKKFKPNQSSIINELFRSLRELTDALQIYLLYFIENAIDIFLEKGLIKHKTFFNSEAQVITFNYTNTYEKLYNSSNNVCHIHGSLDSRLVLGVNADNYDEISNINTSFIAFKKYYQRVRYQTDVDYYERLQEIQEKQRWIGYDECTLFVIGHSLDVTDCEIIRDVFSIAKEIKILYYNEEDIGTYIRNLVEIYGKSDFDKLRTEKNLRFYSLSETAGTT